MAGFGAEGDGMRISVQGGSVVMRRADRYRCRP